MPRAGRSASWARASRFRNCCKGQVLSRRHERVSIHGRKEAREMSATTQKKLLTAEEFYLLPNPGDGSQQELVRGEIITMPPPGGIHGVTCNKAGRRIGNFVEDNHRGTVTSNFAGFITERGPDSV